MRFSRSPLSYRYTYFGPWIGSTIWLLLAIKTCLVNCESESLNCFTSFTMQIINTSSLKCILIYLVSTMKQRHMTKWLRWLYIIIISLKMKVYVLYINKKWDDITANQTALIKSKLRCHLGIDQWLSWDVHELHLVKIER
jgi:hypothetical protein